MNASPHLIGQRRTGIKPQEEWGLKMGNKLISVASFFAMISSAQAGLSICGQVKSLAVPAFEIDVRDAAGAVYPGATVKGTIYYNEPDWEGESWGFKDMPIPIQFEPQTTPGIYRSIAQTVKFKRHWKGVDPFCLDSAGGVQFSIVPADPRFNESLITFSASGDLGTGPITFPDPSIALRGKVTAKDRFEGRATAAIPANQQIDYGWSEYFFQTSEGETCALRIRPESFPADQKALIDRSISDASSVLWIYGSHLDLPSQKPSCHLYLDFVESGVH